MLITLRSLYILLMAVLCLSEVRAKWCLAINASGFHLYRCNPSMIEIFRHCQTCVQWLLSVIMCTAEHWVIWLFPKKRASMHAERQLIEARFLKWVRWNVIGMAWNFPSASERLRLSHPGCMCFRCICRCWFGPKSVFSAPVSVLCNGKWER